MRYTYAYKTSDGQRHEAAIEAKSREEAFEKLRAKGIKAIKVVAADGSKANGEIRGVRKRIVVVLIAVVAVCVGAVAYFGGARSGISSDAEGALMLDSSVRRQIIGDMAIIEKGIKTGWADVFEHEGERFLAGFAVPGVAVSVRNTTEEAIREALARTITANSGDSIEIRQIKAMVEGMKDELRAFLASGGTIVGYGNCLVRRQDEEIGYYTRAENELEHLKKSGASDQDLTSIWESRNDKLRMMGIKLVPFPE